MNGTAAYENLRQLADSWGLVLSGILFLTLVFWPFRPGASHLNQNAAHSIFDEDDSDDCA